MLTVHITGGVVKIAPLTYIANLQFRTLFKLGYDLRDEIAGACGVLPELITGLIHDFCLVSIRVETTHPISEYLANPTTDSATFKGYFLDFVDAIKQADYSSAFDEIIKVVNEFDKPKDEAIAPTLPTDPNL